LKKYFCFYPPEKLVSQKDNDSYPNIIIFFTSLSLNGLMKYFRGIFKAYESYGNRFLNICS